MKREAIMDLGNNRESNKKMCVWKVRNKLDKDNVYIFNVSFRSNRKEMIFEAVCDELSLTLKNTDINKLNDEVYEEVERLVSQKNNLNFQDYLQVRLVVQGGTNINLKVDKLSLSATKGNELYHVNKNGELNKNQSDVYFDKINNQITLDDSARFTVLDTERNRSILKNYISFFKDFEQILYEKFNEKAVKELLKDLD